MPKDDLGQEDNRGGDSKAAEFVLGYSTRINLPFCRFVVLFLWTFVSGFSNTRLHV